MHPRHAARPLLLVWVPMVVLAVIVCAGGGSPAQAASAPATGTYENSSALIRFTGPWTTLTATRLSAGSDARLSAPGRATFTFFGTGIRWVARTNDYSGIARVRIDGKRVPKVDLYSATERFQRVVFTKSWSRPGKHSISIARTGKLNPASSGRGISLDAFVVTDSTAPPAPSRPRLAVEHTGIAVSWDASVASDVSSYRLYRRGSSGGEARLAEVPASELSFFDVGLVAGETYRYRLKAVDGSGNPSAPSPGVTAAMAERAGVVGRYATCPPASTTVSTVGELQDALDTAAAGTVIRLRPGLYSGRFTSSAHGSGERPIWICGPRTAVIDPGDNTRGTGIALFGASHVIITGMTVRHVQKGVLVVGGAHNVISDLGIFDIGNEAVHLRNNTVDNTVIGNTIERTGQLVPQFGEGVYIGSTPEAWCDNSSCEPDRSDRNVIVGNTISATTAEGIEAKPGTSGGEIVRNVLDGSAMHVSTSGGLIVVKGNDWLVESNHGQAAPENAFTATYSKAEGWGRNNVFVRNQADLGGSAGVAVWVQKYIGNRVSCDNRASDPSRLTNVECQV